MQGEAREQDILALINQLERYAEESDAPNAVKTMHAIADSRIPLDVMSKTGLGKKVKVLKSHPDDMIKRMADQLVVRLKGQAQREMDARDHKAGKKPSPKVSAAPIPAAPTDEAAQDDKRRATAIQKLQQDPPPAQLCVVLTVPRRPGRSWNCRPVLRALPGRQPWRSIRPKTFASCTTPAHPP